MWALFEPTFLSPLSCEDARYLQVRMGSSEHERGGLLVQVKVIHIHPMYNDDTIDYDYSVLELEADIPFDDTMQPINLPQFGDALKEGTMLTVSGWGDTHNEAESDRILRQVSVPKVSHADCQNAYAEFGVTDRMLCAGFKWGDKDSCQGDSGGPLHTNGTLVGVVSWGMGCALPNYPGVYSRVATVVPWIKSIIN